MQFKHELSYLIIHCFNWIRRDENSAFKRALDAKLIVLVVIVRFFLITIFGNDYCKFKACDVVIWRDVCSKKIVQNFCRFILSAGSRSNLATVLFKVINNHMLEDTAAVSQGYSNSQLLGKPTRMDAIIF
jgi:hypothetical protein